MTYQQYPDMFIDGVWKMQYTRLYIIKNIPIDTVFIQCTKNEIKSCGWFNLESINRNDHNPPKQQAFGGISQSNFNAARLKNYLQISEK